MPYVNLRGKLNLYQTKENLAAKLPQASVVSICFR